MLGRRREAHRGRGGQAPAPRRRRARPRHVRHARAARARRASSMSDPEDGVPCMWMRGGTSKGGYFLEDDLPADPAERDALPAADHGLARPAPDRRHGRRRSADLEGRGRRARRRAPDVDVDYLFLQVFVDQAVVTDAQNCGNILAGVGPFAIERGLVAGAGERDPVAHLHGQHRPGRGRHGRDARRPGHLCRRRARSTACPAPPRRCRSKFANTAGSMLRRAAADRQRRRRDRRRRAAR